MCPTKSRSRGVHDGRHAEENASRLVKLRGVPFYIYNIGGRRACVEAFTRRSRAQGEAGKIRVRLPAGWVSRMDRFAKTAFDISILYVQIALYCSITASERYRCLSTFDNELISPGTSFLSEINVFAGARVRLRNKNYSLRKKSTVDVINIELGFTL